MLNAVPRGLRGRGAHDVDVCALQADSTTDEAPAGIVVERCPGAGPAEARSGYGGAVALGQWGTGSSPHSDDRAVVGGFTDATFTAMKVLEDGHNAAWPF